MRIRSVFLRSGAPLTGAARGGGSRGSWGAGGGCDPRRDPQLAVPGLRRAGVRAADSAQGMNGKGVLPSRPHCPAVESPLVRGAERAGSSGPLAAQVGSWGQTVARSGPLAGCLEPWVLARPRRPGHRCAFRKGALCAAPPRWPNRLIPRAGLDRGHPGVTEPVTKGRLCTLAGCGGAVFLLTRFGENGNPKRIFKASINAREKEKPCFPFCGPLHSPTRSSGHSVKSWRRRFLVG